MARQGFGFSDNRGYVAREKNGRWRVYHEWADAGGAVHRTMLTKPYRTKEGADKAVAFYQARERGDSSV